MSTYIRLQLGYSRLGVFIDPFYIARRGLLKAIRGAATHLQGDLLDVGCGRKPYQELFGVNSYTGLEISRYPKPGDQADCFYDGERFPFQDQSFDSVLCNQVLEHVFTPKVLLGEISRVLRPGGRALLTVPFAWPEHEQPLDYARYTGFGLQHLATENGFNVIRHEKTRQGAAVPFQLLSAYLFEIISRQPKLLRVALSLLLIAPINLLGVILGKLLPDSDALYLDNLLLLEKREA